MSVNKFTDQFTKVYPLSKSLRFELRPVDGDGHDIKETEKHLAALKQGEELAEKYQQIKPLIDDYHRAYISEKLANPVDQNGELYINSNDFEAAFAIYKAIGDKPNKKGLKPEAYDKKIEQWDKRKKAWQKAQTTLRKKLVKCFDDQKDLFEKSLFTKLLPDFLKNPNNKWEANETNKELVQSFNKFTTYFKGLNENRKNMYSSEDQSTAISYRLMNENLPRFFKSCVSYDKMVAKCPNLNLHIEPTLLKELKELKINRIDEVFQPRFFMNLLTQQGIADFNELRGGHTTKDRDKPQGFNEQINLYRQQNPEQAKGVPFFEKLYKQILSKEETSSFVLDAFIDDQQLLNALAEFIKLAMNEKGFIKDLQEALQRLGAAHFEKTYVLGSGLTNVSKVLFAGDWNLINRALEAQDRALEAQAEKEHPQKGKKISDTLTKKREKFCNQDVFSLAELDSLLANYLEQQEKINNEGTAQTQKEWQDTKKNWLVKESITPLSDYFKKSVINAETTATLTKQITATKALFKLEALDQNRSTPKTDQDTGGKGFQQVQQIKAMLEAFNNILHSLKPLHLVKGRNPIAPNDVDTSFYSVFEETFESYSNNLVPLYNKTRNHLTKKPYQTEKFKLTFSNPTLLDGWDVNKETDNLSVILRKDGLYYLAIMHSEHRKIFEQAQEAGVGEDCYEKVNYKLLPGPNKMLPKVFFSKKGIEQYAPPAEILRLYKNEEHKKGETFKLDSCHKLIDFFKANISHYKKDANDVGWAVFEFQFSPTKNYEDISAFYKEIERQGYKIWFTNIASKYISDAVTAGKLFLFKIYNKDFSLHSKGAKNLHTLYWQGLFEQNNLKDVVLKLNGEAELFYRKRSIETGNQIIHLANQPIKNKTKQAKQGSSKFKYDIIKDKRYTQDKFQFHVPITLNFKSTNVKQFNHNINTAIQHDESVNIIGIDRGEHHLLYYSVIDQNGTIIEQDTLNTIDTGGKGYIVDYKDKLHSKEQERDNARKSWGMIENIKELKAGYLSQVVHKLAKLIIERNAIVCLEDLNFGFKRGRFGIEKQVYQKFERALIEKLNYLVFKDTERSDEAGHYLNAYQLTAPFDSFKKLGKQSGILYYVPAAYTSKIDPATGFINFLNTRYETIQKAQDFFSKMDKICYNAKENYFEFHFDYNKFEVNQDLTAYQTKWIACTHGGDNRYHYNVKQRTLDKINVTDKLESLLQQYKIQYKHGEDIKEVIGKIDKADFFKTLLWLLRLTLTLRHSDRNNDEDYILSPVKDKNGVFFDSREQATLPSDKQTLPIDSDANGAYHIALKGLWNLQQINDWDSTGKLNLAMSYNDWFKFVRQLKQ